MQNNQRELDGSNVAAPGRPVFTVDGHRIGSVKEVRGNYLKIDAPLQRDYWLSCDDLQATEDESLIVSFHDEQLESHKLSAPATEVNNDDLARAARVPVRPVLDEEDQRMQRDLMERELAEQARSLDPSALHAPHEIPGAAPTDVPEGERTRGDALSLDELLACGGQHLVDATDEVIGTIGDIYFDEATREPEWIGVDVSATLGSKRVVAPVRGSYVLDGMVSVPYTRDQVVASGVGDMLITVEREKELYAHYGLPYSREESPTGLAEGTEAEATIEGAGTFMSENGTAPGIVPEAADDEGMQSEPANTAFDAVPSLGMEALAYLPMDEVERGFAARAKARWQRLGNENSAAGTIARRAAAGAVGGLVATVPMTIAMVAMHRRLPRNQRRLPPREITQNLARMAHVDRLVDSREGISKLALAAHAGFGAAAGAVYGLLPASDKAPLPKGAAYGAAVWTASYLGWVPATGVGKSARKEPWKRNAIMLGTNVLWGAVAASVASKLAANRRAEAERGRANGA